MHGVTMKIITLFDKTRYLFLSW